MPGWFAGVWAGAGVHIGCCNWAGGVFGVGTAFPALAEAPKLPARDLSIFPREADSWPVGAGDPGLPAGGRGLGGMAHLPYSVLHALTHPCFVVAVGDVLVVCHAGVDQAEGDADAEGDPCSGSVGDSFPVEPVAEELPVAGPSAGEIAVGGDVASGDVADGLEFFFIPSAYSMKWSNSPSTSSSVSPPAGPKRLTPNSP